MRGGVLYVVCNAHSGNKKKVDEIAYYAPKKERNKKIKTMKHKFYYSSYPSLITLESVLPIGPMSQLLLLSESLCMGFGRSKTAAEGSRFLWPQIQGLVLLLAIKHAELQSLSLRDDSVHARDGFSYLLDFGQLGRGTTSDLLNTKSSKLRLQFIKLFQKLGLLLVSKLVCPDLRHAGILLPGAGKEEKQNCLQKIVSTIESNLRYIPASQLDCVSNPPQGWFLLAFVI